MDTQSVFSDRPGSEPAKYNFRIDQAHDPKLPHRILRERFRDSVCDLVFVEPGRPTWWLDESNQSFAARQPEKVVPVSRRRANLARRRYSNKENHFAAEVCEQRCMLTGILSSVDLLVVSESPQAAEQVLQLQLDSQPVSDTFVFIAADRPEQYSASSQQLVFNSENWDQPQAVQFTAINDELLEGTESYSVSLSIGDENQFTYVKSIDVVVEDFENAVSLVGTDEADEFAFRAIGDSTFELELNDQTWQLGSDDLTVSFDGLGGADSAFLQGADSTDQLTASPNSAILYGEGYKVTAVRSEMIEVDGGAGSGTAILKGSAGDDQWIASPESSQLSGSPEFFEFPYELIATGFDQVVAIPGDGNDSALLTDSPNLDTFVAHAGYVYLGGHGFYNIGIEFESATATAVHGTATAGIYDSPDDDVVTISPQHSTFDGGGYSYELNGFGAVRAYSTRGGQDSVTMAGSTGDDRFISKSDHSYIVGDDYYGFAGRFESVQAESNGGADQAQFYDAGLDDYFVETAQRAVHQKVVNESSAVVEALGFAEVTSFVAEYAPFDMEVPGFDRDLLRVGREIASGSPIPDGDWRFAFAKSLVELKESTSTAELSEQILPQLNDWYDSQESGESLKQIGYHDLIPVGGILSDGVDGSLLPQHRTLVDRFGLTSQVTTMKAAGQSRGTVVLMHGSYSLPGYMTGELTLQNGKDEYHHTPALTWQAAGYDVVVPEMQGSTWIELPELGYSFLGFETARMVDLISSLSANSDLPIVVAGLSRGATIAELTGYISTNVDVTVSSGGALRRIADESELGNAAFLEKFSDRKLVISAASNDSYAGWHYDEAKSYVDQLAERFDQDGGSLSFVTFDGYHEMWAGAESSRVTLMLNEIGS